MAIELPPDCFETDALLDQDGLIDCLNDRIEELDEKCAALTEELDLLRARAPRAYIMTRKAEWMRMFREAIGYLRACRREHHGTDREGRHHLMDALEGAMRDLGEAESERRERKIKELRADEQFLQKTSEGNHG